MEKILRARVMSLIAQFGFDRVSRMVKRFEGAKEVETSVVKNKQGKLKSTTKRPSRNSMSKQPNQLGVLIKAIRNRKAISE